MSTGTPSGSISLSLVMALFLMRTHPLVTTAAAGVVETWVEITEVSLPLVAFRHTYCFENGSSLMRRFVVSRRLRGG